MISLPVDPLLPGIVDALRAQPNLVLEAPPGAGKTTRVPPALLDAGMGEVVVLEPRRIAARLAARRVAEERGERLGESVGYQVRFEHVAGPATKLRFLTEGVLTRRLLADPALDGVGAVVLDEFHERHLEGDLALALLRRLQRGRRPDLRLLVMSATLHGEPVARFLGDCPVVRSEGRLFPLAVEHTPHSAAPLEERVAEAAARLLREMPEGDILVFLPGAAEIRRCQRACEGLASRLDLLLAPLYGDLPPEEQDAAVLPSRRRKLILSTNVAESSITIDGVRAVIDSGLARVATDSPWSGLPRVEVSRVSRASATQRAGRAGRTGPGRVVRLYPEEDFLRRSEYDTPEIARRELSQLSLDLHAAGVRDPAGMEWLEAPPRASLEAAEGLLRRLGALDAAGAVTATGRKMAAFPLHPRIARFALAADEMGAGEDGCRVAARLSAGERLPEKLPHPAESDLLLLLEREPSPGARRMEQQLLRLVRPRTSGHRDEALLQAALLAFPDRVARRRKSLELRVAGGLPANLARGSAMHDGDLMVCVEIEDRPDLGTPLVRIASGIRAEWLLDHFPERLTERTAVEWNKAAERVEQSSAMLFDDLAIEESRSHTPDPERAAELLAEKAMEAGLGRFTDADALEELRRRAAFAMQHAALPALDEASGVRTLCYGLRGFAELETAARDGAMERAIVETLGRQGAALLEEVAPSRIRLPNGRHARVSYPPGQEPWVSSRLQDFFGMRETPRVARGKVAVVVHLLAPNQRPVQMTRDLEGFWERLYPEVRRELSRRYPKHAWPENPYTVERR